MPNASWRAWKAVRPVTGLIATFLIASGLCSATSSMSMPPSALAIRIGQPAARSTRRPRYSSLAIFTPSSIEQALDLAALGTGLVGDQGHAEDLLGRLLGRGGILDDLDAAALAASAGVDLGLHDGHAAAETPGDRAGLLGRERDFPAGHRHAVPGQDGLCLILVNLHRSSLNVVDRGAEQGEPGRGIDLDRGSVPIIRDPGGDGQACGPEGRCPRGRAGIPFRGFGPPRTSRGCPSISVAPYARCHPTVQCLPRRTRTPARRDGLRSLTCPVVHPSSRPRSAPRSSSGSPACCSSDS